MTTPLFKWTTHGATVETLHAKRLLPCCTSTVCLHSCKLSCSSHGSVSTQLAVAWRTDVATPLIQRKLHIQSWSHNMNIYTEFNGFPSSPLVLPITANQDVNSLKMSKTNLAYDVDLKEQISHVEYDANHRVDLHDAAAAGHLATDERGNPLVDIDEVASRRLARKVRCSRIGIALGASILTCLIDRYVHCANCSVAVPVRFHRQSQHR